MVLFIPALVLAISEPKTFEEFEIAKIEALHGVEHFQSEVHMEITQTGQAPTVLDFSLTEDKNRSHMVVRADGEDCAEIFCDGVHTWGVMPDQKKYWKANALTSEKFEPKKELLITHDEVQFNFMSDHQIQFACGPGFKVEGPETVREGGEVLRKVVASGDSSGGHATVSQWFLPNQWILKRFSVHSQGKKGVSDLEGTVTKMEFNADCPASGFAPDPVQLATYKKIQAPRS